MITNILNIRGLRVHHCGRTFCVFCVFWFRVRGQQRNDWWLFSWFACGECVSICQKKQSKRYQQKFRETISQNMRPQRVYRQKIQRNTVGWCVSICQSTKQWVRKEERNNTCVSIRQKYSQNGINKSFAKQSVKTCDHNVFTAKKYSEIQWADEFQSANQQNNERGKRNETMHMFQSAKITVKTVSTKVSRIN